MKIIKQQKDHRPLLLLLLLLLFPLQLLPFPGRYRCMGQPCMAPSNVPDAPSVPCVEGALIAHGSDCTLMCDLGFVPSLSNLSCNATLFEPSNFSCRSGCLTLPAKPHHVELRNGLCPHTLFVNGDMGLVGLN